MSHSESYFDDSYQSPICRYCGQAKIEPAYSEGYGCCFRAAAEDRDKCVGGVG